MRLENGVVLRLGTKGILEDIQRVTPIACPSVRVFEWILAIRVHLRERSSVSTGTFIIAFDERF